MKYFISKLVTDNLKLSRGIIIASPLVSEKAKPAPGPAAEEKLTKISLQARWWPGAGDKNEPSGKTGRVSP
jgi:hypothetical protein